jgi:hypothetical protein
MSAMAILGFIFSLVALAKVRKLENRLKEAGVLPREDSGDKV